MKCLLLIIMSCAFLKNTNFLFLNQKKTLSANATASNLVESDDSSESESDVDLDECASDSD